MSLIGNGRSSLPLRRGSRISTDHDCLSSLKSVSGVIQSVRVIWNGTCFQPMTKRVNESGRRLYHTH